MQYTCPMHPEILEDRPGNCPICAMALHSPTDPSSLELKMLSYRLFFSLIGFVPLFFLCMSKKNYPLIQATLATAVVWIGGWPLIKKGVDSFVLRKLNMFSLISLGIATTYVYSLVLLFLSSENPLYFEAAGAITILTLTGQVLELKSRNKAANAIEKLKTLSPSTAKILINGEEKEIPVEQIQIGDILRLKPGSKIPTDGILIEGSGFVDESMTSGESFPVLKKRGDRLIGATLNKNGSFVMRAEKVGKDTFLSKIIELVSKAQFSHPPIQSIADRICAYFVPTIITIALITLILWIAFGPSTELAIQNAVSVLLIACPCALGLAAPLSVMVAVGKAALSGIFIKNGAALERLSKISTIILDKTGTLTEGKLQVSSVVCLTQKADEKLIIQLAASLEQASDHPISFPLIEKAKEKKIDLLPFTDFSILEGKGIIGKIDGKIISVGNQTLLTHLDIQRENITLLPNAIYVVEDQTVLGYLTILDPLKDSSVLAVKELFQQGIEVILVTGDQKEKAVSIGKLLGIEEIHAQMLPEDKGKFIQALQRQGKIVAMVGDGINDAPALAIADVGIAMGNGVDIAIESASITLFTDNLQALSKTRKLALATMRLIRQNLFLAFLYNILSIPIAAGIFYPFWKLSLNPMIASAAMVLSSLSIALNSLRLRDRKNKLLIVFLLIVCSLAPLSVYLIYENKKITSPKTLQESIQEMMPFHEAIISIEKMKGGFANDIWQVFTENGHYILRQKTKKVKNSSFIKDLEMYKKAFLYGIGPEVVGVNVYHQQMLIRYIESKPWPSFEENSLPYFETMQLLRAFHEKMPASLRFDRKSTYAPFDYTFDVGKRLEAEGNMPIHFSLALKKMQQIFEMLKPWLKENAKLCHGDFCKQNVLLSTYYVPTLIDFDSAAIGDPVFDIVKFSLNLAKEQRLNLFSAYLGKPTLSEDDLMHFEIMDLSLLMLVTTIRFQAAMNSPLLDKLSKVEMEEILNSKESLPSFLDVPFEDSSPKARQLGAIYALAEFLKRSDSLSIFLQKN